MAFWGVEIKPGKPYSHTYDREHGRLRISQATLGIGKSTKKSSLQCNVGNKSPILLCNLIPNVSESFNLKLEFEEDDEVTFSVLGQTSVHLSGYYLGGAMNGDESDSYGEDISGFQSESSGSYDEEEEFDAEFINDGDMEMFPPSRCKSSVTIEEVEEDETPSNEKIEEKNRQSNSDDGKIKQHAVVESEDEDGFPVSSSSRASAKQQQNMIANDKKSSQINSNKKKSPIESDKGEKDNDVKERVATDNSDKKVKKEKKSKKGKVSEAVTDEPVEKTDDIKKDNKDPNVDFDIVDKEQNKVIDNDVKEKVATDNSDKKVKKKKKSKKGKVSEAVTDEPVEKTEDIKKDNKDPNVDFDIVDKEQNKVIDSTPGKETSGKQKKNKKKRAKEDKDSTVDGEKVVDVNQAVAKKIKKENGKDLTPSMEQKEKTKASKYELKTRTLADGLVIEDLVMGKSSGKKAVPGKKVAVNYIGKLQKNGKIFDSNVGQRPFQFRLGKGEVIRGWDVGVNGMKVGDKRKLTIPPSYGYGNRNMGPIPANSWLTFDVELVSVQ